MVSLGRMMVAYPTVLADAPTKRTLNPKSLCGTFSDGTAAPRNGSVSGCYPLDKFYVAKPEFQRLKEIRRAIGA